MTETLQTTPSNYQKCQLDNGQIVYRNPEGQFCKEKQFNISKGRTEDFEDLDAYRLGDEKDEELGRGEAPEPPQEITRLEDIKNWDEKDGAGYVGKVGGKSG